MAEEKRVSFLEECLAELEATSLKNGVLHLMAAQARKELEELRTDLQRAERRLDVAVAARDALRQELIQSGCACTCEHHSEDHDEDCQLCLACRVESALGEMKRWG